jgi:hypothetical protein
MVLDFGEGKARGEESRGYTETFKKRKNENE